MSPAGAVAGVDAGASHTEVLITDVSGAPRIRDRGPAGAVRPGRERASADVVMALVAGAARRSGVPRIEALVVGAAGAGSATTQSRLADLLRALGAPDRTRVVTDAETAYHSVFGDDAGILLLSGTGSIALARDVAGSWHRFGGRGWRVGDEGSGFALGRAALSMLATGSPSSLRSALPREAGVPDVPALLHWADGAGPEAVAALGIGVQAAAREGDEVAGSIVAGAADDLVAHVVALLPHFSGAAGVALVIGGGAVRPGSPLRDATTARLRERVPGVTVLDRAVDAAAGAAALAARAVARARP